MKLDFTKVGALICPTDADGQLVENVLKCTVTSEQSSEQTTFMTLTVTVDAEPPGPGLTSLTSLHANRVTWECASTTCPTRRNRCVHVGSEPRLCVDDRGLTVTWRTKP